MNTQPRTITRSDPTQLAIEWQDGHTTLYQTSELRSLCPCAACVDEMSGVRTHNPASVDETLTHRDVQLVGNYALTVYFGDGHNTGIFPFRMLRENDPASAE